MSNANVFATISEAIALREAERPTEARHLMEAIVGTVEAGSDAFARVFLAHSLADVQEDPHEELAWDLRALEAMDDLSEERAREREVPGGRDGLLPSLHLNLAWDYQKLGDAETAERHLEIGRSYLHALGDDEYGDAIRRSFAEGI